MVAESKYVDDIAKGFISDSDDTDEDNVAKSLESFNSWADSTDSGSN